jgi:flagellar biosynthesis protein FliQ
MGLESKAHSTVIKVRTPLFLFSVVLVHILYLAVFFGVVLVNETYIRYLSTMIQTFVAIFLTIRFNPYLTSDYRITEFDKQVIFYSATFLLLNVVATEVYTSFIKNSPLEPLIKTAQSKMDAVLKSATNGTQKTT